MMLLQRRFGWDVCIMLAAVAVLWLTPVARGQAIIDVTTQSAPVNTLTINDIDFVNATAPKWLFTIDLRTRDGSTVDATMKIDLTVVLADGENFNNQPVVSLVTTTFRIAGSRTFTNLDFRDSRLRSEYEVNSEAKHHFEQTALPTGRMPAGAYNFLVEVTPVGAGTSTGTFVFNLSNPSSLELLFPADGDAAVNQFPLFQWLFDGTLSTLAVFEKLPGQVSLEETASGTPQLTASVASTSFQYPAAGVRTLEPGKTYVWYVEGHIRTAGGIDNILRSPLRSFTVQPMGGAPDMTILDDLERAMDSKYKPLFDQIRADGLSPSGMFRLNGSPISRTDLLRLISQLQGNPDGVISADLTN